MQRSWEFWNVKQNEKFAIFYQTISFCLQSRCAYQDNEDLYSYVEKLMKEVSVQGSIEKPIYNYSNFEDINNYLEREINNTVHHQFPKEWTVIQLCKNFNPVALSSKYDEIINYNTGISLTVFKHSAIKDMLMLEINKPKNSENLFEKVYKLNKKILESLNYSKMPKDTAAEKTESKEKYWKATKELDIYIQDMVTILKSFIGPWMCVMTGNFKSRKSIETENEIKQKVNEFLMKRSYSEQQEKLIHLVARRTDLLTHQQIFVAITYILRDKSSLGYSDVDLNDIYDHITWIKQEFVYEDVSTHPCILIVDELLDQLPFEMVNTQQEFTRVCSFANLKRLFERYCGSMENGYVLCPTTNCQAIVNPDGTLSVMEERMRNFFNYWLPSWKLTCNQKPSKDEFCEILSQTDALVYCGHGSGLTLSCDYVYNLKTKAIVFLFGCGSVSLTSSGLNSELKGAHVYYHIGWSPVVVGFLWTVTDFNTDYCSTKMLSAWINSPQSKAHWQCLDKATWKKNGNMGESTFTEKVPPTKTNKTFLSFHKGRRHSHVQQPLRDHS
jgi:separase